MSSLPKCEFPGIGYPQPTVIHSKRGRELARRKAVLRLHTSRYRWSRIAAARRDGSARMSTHDTNSFSLANEADVIVIGAGPGGSTAAYHLARQGRRVILLEKTQFPREKVCGDGLTPRAVKQLMAMGVISKDGPREGDGWARNRGLRVIGDGVSMELDWPQLTSFPDYGLTRTRLDFDQLLAEKAEQGGVQLHTRTTATEPLTNRDGRVVGVRAATGPEKEPVVYRAPLVIAADGVSARFALAVGITKREDRPMGVAVRRYYHSPAKHEDPYLESWLSLRGENGTPLPGYGWIFGLGDGRVNVGLGVLNSTDAFRNTDYRQLLTDWLAATPQEWGLSTIDNADGPTRGAALPMGFNRVPHYTNGVMLVGDSGGMVNPFNGEGIAYAMEAGALAAEIADAALTQPSGAVRERMLLQYRVELQQRYGGYYRMGGWFAKLIGEPHFMKLALRFGLPQPVLMRFVLKLLANLIDPRSKDAADRVIAALSAATPSV